MDSTVSPNKDELKKADWFLEHLSAWARAAAEHRTAFYLVTALAASGVSVGIGLYHFQQGKEREALAKLEELGDAYQSYLGTLESAAEAGAAEAGEKLRGELKAVAEDYSRTRSGALANLYLGDLLFAEKKFAEALTAYERYRRLLPAHHPFRAVVLSNIGYCQEELGDHRQAAASFVQAAAAKGALQRDQAYLNAARNFEKSGDVAQATVHYQKIIDEFPESAYQPLARTKVARLALPAQ